MSTTDLHRIVTQLREDTHGGSGYFIGQTVYTMDVYKLLRAVLRAIREPSEGMTDDMIQKTYGAPSEEWRMRIAMDVWHAGVDHLLEE